MSLDPGGLVDRSAPSTPFPETTTLKLATALASFTGLALLGTAIAFPNRNPGDLKIGDTRTTAALSSNETRNGSADAPAPKNAPLAPAKPNDSKIAIDLDGSTAVKLLRAGIRPASLSSAGLTPLEAVQVINRAKDFFASDTTLAAADAALATCKPKIEPLSSKVKSGKASYEEALELSAAREALVAAEAAQAAALGQALSAATSGLNESQRAALTTIQANSAWQLPTQYLVITQEESAWVKLRDALDAVTASAAEGWPAPKAALDLISQVRQQPAVAAAEQGLSAHLAELQAAWDSALQK